MDSQAVTAEAIYCKFKDTRGAGCGDFAYKDGLCYWHYNGEIKNDADLREKLEARAKTGAPMRYFKLRNASLQNLSLVNHGQRKGYDLSHADLYRADLRNAHLFMLDLSFSSLMKADLRGANLHATNFEHANLLGIRLDDAKLEGAEWGDIVRQERQADFEADPERRRQLYSEAEEIYRLLARAMRKQDLESEIGKFFYRSMVVRRKQMPQPSLARFFSAAVDISCGYGEKPVRLALFSLLLIVCFAFIFALLGLTHDGTSIQMSRDLGFFDNLSAFLSACYFSIVTFTTLGYGDIAPLGLARLFAVVEAFSGSFIMALYVVVFVRKMGVGRRD